MNTRNLAAFSLLIVAVGCGPAQHEPTNGLGPNEAQASANSMASSIESSASSYSQAGAAGFTATCHTINPATPPDADMDNIPDVETTVTFTNCVDGNTTFNGSFVVEDTLLGSASFNFAASQQGVALVSTSNVTASFNVTASLDASEASGVYSVAENASGSVTYDGPDGNLAFTETRSWTSSFTPDDGAYVPVDGAPVEDGTFTVDGSYAVTFSGVDGQGNTYTHAGSASIETVTNLRIDDACATHIVSGTVEASFAGDGQVASVTITWNGCDSHTVTVNSAPQS